METVRYARIGAVMAILGFIFVGLKPILAGLLGYYAYQSQNKFLLSLFLYMVTWIMFGFWNSILYVVITIAYVYAFNKEAGDMMINKLATQLNQQTQYQDDLAPIKHALVVLQRYYNTVFIQVNDAIKKSHEFNNTYNIAHRLDQVEHYLEYATAFLWDFVANVSHFNDEATVAPQKTSVAKSPVHQDELDDEPLMTEKVDTPDQSATQDNNFDHIAQQFNQLQAAHSAAVQKSTSGVQPTADDLQNLVGMVNSMSALTTIIQQESAKKSA